MRHIVFFGFAIVIALAPVPLGSNRAWSWSPLAVVVGLLLLTWSAAAFVQADQHGKAFARLRSLRVPVVLFVLVVGWGALQLSGWTPTGWKSSISTAGVPGFPSMPQTSVAFEHEQGLTGLMRLLTYAGVFVLALTLTSTASDARRLLAVIVCSAVVYTLYAMVADVANRMSSATGFTMWVPHRYVFRHVFSGTFINANTYATYAGVSALAALTLAMQHIPSTGFRESSAQRWRRRLGMLTGRAGLWFAAALILTMGVLLSGSRAGLASFVIAIMAMVALYGRGIARWGLSLLVMLGLAALTLLTPAGSTFMTRTVQLFDQGGEIGRQTLFPLTANAISLRPVVGWGMNSFESLYQLFQPPTLPDYFDKAHNTYLELAFDLGIPAAALLVLAVGWMVVRCLVGFFSRSRDRELSGLGFLAGLLVGIHALFDFSLQIPGMACVFFVILGVACAQSWSSRA